MSQGRPPRLRSRLVGERGLLVEAADAAQIVALTHWIRGRAVAIEVDDIVPGVCTVFVIGAPAALERLADALPTAALASASSAPGRRVVVPVRYDGADLADVAERSGLSVRDVVRLHSGAEYRVDFFGFAPGFAFLSGLPALLRLPRRDSPRTRVPEGSVAIANEYTAVYPSASPGGWHLIGTRTGPALWDAHAAQPNAIDVGDLVVFEERS